MARFEPRPDRMAGRFARPLWMAAGATLVGVGAIGLFVPLLPTTIFLILAAACFGRSSPRAYRWLTTNRAFGPALRDYNEGHGATVPTKVSSIAFLWVGLGLAAWWLWSAWIAAALAVVGIGVTWHVLRLRTVGR